MKKSKKSRLKSKIKIKLFHLKIAKGKLDEIKGYILSGYTNN
jgi:hypothetical protein